MCDISGCWRCALMFWKEDGDLPELSRLIIAAESDSDLLSLINAVVDSAEEKGIFRLMNDQPNAS